MVNLSSPLFSFLEDSLEVCSSVPSFLLARLHSHTPSAFSHGVSQPSGLHICVISTWYVFLDLNDYALIIGLGEKVGTSAGP